MGRARRVAGRPVVLAAALIVLAGTGFGLYWFEPWTLWVDETVHEELPVAATSPAPERTDGTTASPSAPPSPAATPTTVARGEFISHEHGTSGTARVLRLADGSLVLRLEELDTSNGPDLHVWLTDAPVIEGRDGWHVFDDGTYLSAGALKGNRGDQNYPLPADTDLDDFTSVSIWCARFSVSFGAAELTRI
ncbi:DM13 domain-containing protein [Streptomyces litchfieldiae]|uniref:DM13 domain-containing protein n=1 Tax=Streptomyces litchfieldiae TaxID=3075543 RepID=A0ABU2MVL5_9ACTN|nr:DM13 domain-containing protein [Streptomyces sp. DSM 44938]MDT0345134.1 DM13 domain-containing protein [Streptomyces sp. DSM 44938]